MLLFLMKLSLSSVINSMSLIGMFIYKSLMSNVMSLWLFSILI